MKTNKTKIRSNLQNFSYRMKMDFISRFQVV